ncbi:hypothetical protein PanWU01x14_348110 [Parasponia andersonii]|uniref:Uncharacterized protein n=1 Tax=Parasponia andersonii TaxID=3476 RepID=A0A2P5ABS4_PARAD|nr:hypothetical protein PanWU01x14_348110 [Parasponia andersonii]
MMQKWEKSEAKLNLSRGACAAAQPSGTVVKTQPKTRDVCTATQARSHGRAMTSEPISSGPMAWPCHPLVQKRFKCHLVLP